MSKKKLFVVAVAGLVVINLAYGYMFKKALDNDVHDFVATSTSNKNEESIEEVSEDVYDIFLEEAVKIDYTRKLHEITDVDYILSKYGAFEVQFSYDEDKAVDDWDTITVYEDGVVKKNDKGLMYVATLGTCFRRMYLFGNPSYYCAINLGSEMYEEFYSNHWENLELCGSTVKVDSYLEDGDTTILWCSAVTGLKYIYAIVDDMVQYVTVKDSNGINMYRANVVPILDNNYDVHQCMSRDDVQELYKCVFDENTDTPVVITEINGDESFDYVFNLAKGVVMNIYTKNNDCYLYDENNDKGLNWVTPVTKLHYEVGN